MKKGIFLTSVLLSTLSFSDYQIHILKEGETLSELLNKRGYNPLYKENGWVEKVLEMNHLTKEQAYKIKKGYPILLPTEKNLQASNKIVFIKDTKYKKISYHQDVIFDFGIGQNTFHMDDKELNSNQHLIEFSVISNMALFKTYFNHLPFGTVKYKSINSLIDDKSDQSISLRPNYSIELGFYNKINDYNFISSLETEQRSLLTYNNTYQTRRDYNTSVNIGLMRSFELNKLDLKASTKFSRSMYQVTQDSKEVYYFNKIDFKLSSKLTHTMGVGIKFEKFNFEKINLKSQESLSLNLSYNLK